MPKAILKHQPLIHSSSLPLPPAPAVPYQVRQENLFLTFTHYGPPIPGDPARRIVLRAMNSVSKKHGVHSEGEIGRKVGFSLRPAEPMAWLNFTLDPEANMTWGMFFSAMMGIDRFLERWDNVEFAVDVGLRMDGGLKVGTMRLDRI